MRFPGPEVDQGRKIVELVLFVDAVVGNLDQVDVGVVKLKILTDVFKNVFLKVNPISNRQLVSFGRPNLIYLDRGGMALNSTDKLVKKTI